MVKRPHVNGLFKIMIYNFFHLHVTERFQCLNEIVSTLWAQQDNGWFMALVGGLCITCTFDYTDNIFTQSHARSAEHSGLKDTSNMLQKEKDHVHRWEVVCKTKSIFGSIIGLQWDKKCLVCLICLVCSDPSWPRTIPVSWWLVKQH